MILSSLVYSLILVAPQRALEDPSLPPVSKPFRRISTAAVSLHIQYTTFHGMVRSDERKKQRAFPAAYLADANAASAVFQTNNL